MKYKINDEKAKRDEYTHLLPVPGTWYFAQYLVVLCVVLKKAQDSAPQGC